MKGRWEKILSI